MTNGHRHRENDPNSASAKPLCAAEYVRMSTDHQRYSTENQAGAIRQYASARGIEIVQTYADEGKSGLRLDGRDALKRLIEDVQNGRSGFQIILVYDISRWGRFQDADESAYYEHICKRAGITVQYCAEPFENDGSPVSTIVKGVKRAMAGEYSRELSAKVFIGQCRLIELGFRQGGAPGFGLRRMLVDQTGTLKGELTRGQQKSIQTDRILLTQGPDAEVDIVRRIYRTFVEKRQSERQIAEDLNNEGVLTDLGRTWTRGTVHQVLINEKYVGNNVWNRVSFKLKKKRVRNGSDMWIRADNVFPAIVERPLFEAAQAIIQTRSVRLTDTEMLGALTGLFGREGILSGLIIDEAEGLPSSSAYRSRFGSLLRVYELIGYRPRRDYRYIEINRALRQLYPGIVQNVIDGLESRGCVLQHDADLIMVNGEFSLSVVISRCRRMPSGSLRWWLRFDTGLQPDITVAVRMDSTNQIPMDFYLLPGIDIARVKLKLAEDNGLALDAYRFDTLEVLYDLAAPVHLMEAA